MARRSPVARPAPAAAPVDPFARTRALAKSAALRQFLRGIPITEATARAFWDAPPHATGAALQAHLSATEGALRQALQVAGTTREVPDLSTVYGLLNLHRLLVEKFAPGYHVEPATTPLFKPNGADEGPATVEITHPDWGSWAMLVTPQYDVALYSYAGDTWRPVARGRLDDGRLSLNLDYGWEHPAFRDVLPQLEAAFAGKYPPAPRYVPRLDEADPGEIDPAKFAAIRNELFDEYRQPHAKPWIVGFSGGKDSTLLLQLVFEMLLEMPPSRRTRKVYVVSNDTQVESPIVQAFIDKTLAKLRAAAEPLLLPVEVVQTRPAGDETFWVNLIGRGYRAPTRHFRWCTDRMKIRPTGAFIQSTTDAAGGSILLLGVRHDESKTRSKSIQRHGSERLNPHKVTPGCWVFRPIQHLTTSEVWAYLLQRRPPWGGSHRELWTLYRNAMGGECPFVTDESDAPSCGNNPSSRFGCWTCTVVDKDKSLEGFVAAGFEHLEPLVEFRDWIKVLSDDYSRRETQRRDASEGIGPFTIATRKEILARLLDVQKELGVPLITESELHAIHNLWSEDTLFRATGVINQLRTAEGLPLVTMRRGKAGREVTGLPPTRKGRA